MTHQELGLQLRQIYPQLQKHPGTATQLAQFFLKNYPEYQDLISPIARRVNEIIERPIESNRFTEKGRLESHNLIIKNQVAEISMLHHAENVIRASSMNVPVEVLSRLAELDAEHHHKMEYEKFVMSCGLDGTIRNTLRPLEVLQHRRIELNSLIEERDNESHPDKREVLDILIEAAKEELRGRANQAMVQAGGRRLRESNENTETERSSGTSVKGDVEPISIKGFRMGE